MKRRIIYGILLAVSLYIGFLYHYPETRFLIAFVLLLPVMCLLSLLFWRGRCAADLTGGGDMILKGETARFCIRLENRSFLPISMVRVRLVWEEPGSGEVHVREFCRSMEGSRIGNQVKRDEDHRRIRIRKKKTEVGRKSEPQASGGKVRAAELEIPLNMEAEHCGPINLKITWIKVYDFLQLTCLTKKEVCQNRVLVAPCVHSMEIRMENSGLEEAYLPYQGAAENMEGYRIRQYQPGDHLHRVHWKLSAKADELQVKDFDRQAGGQVSLLLAVCADEPEWDSHKWDNYLEAAVSLLFSLFYADGTALRQVMWPEKEGGMQCVDIHGEKDLQKCLESLLELTPADLDKGWNDTMPDVPQDCLCLTMELELFRGEEYLLSLSDITAQGWDGLDLAI